MFTDREREQLKTQHKQERDGRVRDRIQRLVMHEDLTLNAASTIRFFNKIEEAYPDKRRMHIFCDNSV